MDLVVGGDADREGQVLLAGLLEEFFRLVNVDVVGIRELRVPVLLQTGDDGGAGLGAVAVADLVDDIVRVNGVGDCLAHAHILEGLEIVVEGQELDGVGVAGIFHILGSLDLLAAVGVGVEAVDGAGDIVGRQLGRVLIVLEGDAVEVGRLSPVVLVLCQQGVVLLHELAHDEGAGSDGVGRQILCILGDDGVGDDRGEAAVGCVQVDDQGHIIRGRVLGIRDVDLVKDLLVIAFLVLLGLVDGGVGLAAGIVGVDLIVAGDGGGDGLLHGIQDIIHGHLIAVVELDALTKGEGIGLQIIGDLAVLRQHGLEAAVGLGAHQALVDVEEDTSGIRGLCREGVKTGCFGGDALDEISALDHLTCRGCGAGCGCSPCLGRCAAGSRISAGGTASARAAAAAGKNPGGHHRPQNQCKQSLFHFQIPLLSDPVRLCTGQVQLCSIYT